jgi:predicted metal-dependent RNase
MAQGGFARRFIEETKDDPETSIVFCGYLAQNTLGQRLVSGLDKDIYHQSIQYCRYSGHSSNQSLNKFLNDLEGKKILVHLGELSKEPFKLKDVALPKRDDAYIPYLGERITI